MDLEINRKTGIKAITGGTLVALGVGGCTDQELAWRQLPAKERVGKLELKLAPHFRNFSARNEMAVAVAELYCSLALPCRYDSQYIKDNVLFLPTAAFIDKVEQDQGIILGPERAEIEQLTEIVTHLHTNQVLINVPRFEARIQRLNIEQPNYQAEIGNRDPEMVLFKSILFHAYSHLNQSKRTIRLNPPINIRQGQLYSLDRYRSFIFGGQNESGNQIYFNGASEAMTEITGFYVQQLVEGGRYLTANSGYSFGAALINKVNQATGVSVREYIDYYQGQKDELELFSRWARFTGNKLPGHGILALALVGLTVTDKIQKNDPEG